MGIHCCTNNSLGYKYLIKNKLLLVDNLMQTDFKYIINYRR